MDYLIESINDWIKDNPITREETFGDYVCNTGWNKGMKLDWVGEANKKRVWTDKQRESIAASNKRRSTPVYCPELEVYYENYVTAARDLGISHECIRRVIRGQRKTTHGLTFQEVG